MSDERFVRVVDEGDVLRITLARPPFNILTIEMLHDLAEALQDAKRGSVKAVVFAAEGKAFCAGVAVEDHLGDRATTMLTAFHAVFRRLAALDCATIAVVHGAALGGGAELATFCDVVVASDNATFGQPEVKVGVFAPVAVAHYPRRVGAARAARLLLTGQVVTAAEAERIGLVDRVVAPGRLAEAVEAEVAGFRALSAAVLRLTKRALREASGLSFDHGLAALENIYNDDLMNTADAQEGLRAFLEKRPPVWRDR